MNSRVSGKKSPLSADPVVHLAVEISLGNPVQLLAFAGIIVPLKIKLLSVSNPAHTRKTPIDWCRGDIRHAMVTHVTYLYAVENIISTF